MNAELKINETLPVLAFNFEQLKAWAAGLTERYADLVVSEDAIADVKRDMAEINKAKKAVDDARKEAVRRVSEPIRTFEGQIKEVCAIFDTAYARLGEQVKAFEDAQREDKRNTVEGIIMSALHNAFGPFEPGKPSPLQIPVQEKWLNKTISFKVIREDIAAIVERHMEEEQRKKALEQARQDRAAAIESHVKALNDKYSLNMPVSRFLVGMGMNTERPLSNVLADITQAYANVIENAKREQQAAKNAAPAMQSASPGAAVKSSPQPENAGLDSVTSRGKPESPAQTRAMSIVLEYEIANEAAVKACLENLKTLCVNFGARYRQE